MAGDHGKEIPQRSDLRGTGPGVVIPELRAGPSLSCHAILANF